MKNKRLLLSLCALTFIASFAMVPAFAEKQFVYADSTGTGTTLKLTDNRPNRPVFNHLFDTDFEAFMFKMTSLKTGLSTDKSSAVKSTPTKIVGLSFDSQKPIDNVKVYPNPVADQLNLSFSLKKEGLVTIKILDVLGNEVSTLFNQKVAAGVQTNKFSIDNKLNSGFYFVRIIFGSESIVKRISVL